MNAADRKFLIKRALLRALDDCAGFPATETAVREAAGIKVDYLRATVAETDAALAEIETDRLATALPSERGRKFSLTDAGRHWLAQNA